MVKLSYDALTETRELGDAARRKLERHENELTHYIRNEFSRFDLEDILDSRVGESPFIWYQMLEQSRTPERDKIRDLINSMISGDGRIDVITGAQRSGKTATAIYLAERVHRETGETIYWLGPPADLPEFIEARVNINDIPPGATVIIDESSVQFFSRNSMDQDQNDFIQRLPVESHKKRNFIVVTQSTKITDVQFFRLSNSMIFKGSASFTNLQNDQGERATIDEELSLFMPQQKSDVLYFDDEGIKLFSHGLPDCWSDKLSRPYRSFDDGDVSDLEADANLYRFLLNLYPQTSKEQMREYASIRGAEVTENDIRFIELLLRTEEREDLLEMDDEDLVDRMEQGYSDTPMQVKSEFADPDRWEDPAPGEGNIYEFRLQDETSQMILERRRDANEEFDLFSRYNATDIMHESLKNRLRDRESNIILSIRGETGSGKSEAGLSIAEQMVEIFDKGPAEYGEDVRVYFDRGELVADLESVPRKTVLILDEQTREHGTGSQRVLDALRNKEDTLRKRQICFIFISPSWENHSHHYMAEMMGIDEDLETSRLFLWKPHDEQRYPVGYITLLRSREEIREQYEQDKEEYLDRQQNDEGRSKAQVEKAVRMLLVDPPDKFIYAKNVGMAETVIERHTALTGGEVGQVLDDYRMTFMMHHPEDFDPFDRNANMRGQNQISNHHLPDEMIEKYREESGSAD